METTVIDTVFSNVDLSSLSTQVLAVAAVSISLALAYKAWTVAKGGIKRA
jgi:hypothetical protein